MLTRRYAVVIDEGETNPLVVSNAVNYDIVYGNDDPNEAELKAPSLIVKLRKHYGDGEPEPRDSAAWGMFTTNYTNDLCVPAEILDAMSGKESNWRVVRCEICPKHLFFLLIDPQKWTADKSYDLGSSVAEDLECGELWVYWNYDNDAGTSYDVEITTLGDERYEISCMQIECAPGKHINTTLRSSNLNFTEYRPDGEISRISRVFYDARNNDTPFTINVTEFLNQ